MNKNNSVPGVPVVVPVIKYENSDLLKFTILSDNKGKSGIYSWINKINQKRYVGSSEVLDRRIRQYFNINHLIRNSNLYICRALKKYGYYNFSLEILEYCEAENLHEREDEYLNLLEPEYNILREAGSSGGYIHDDKAKKKMRANRISSVKIEVTDLQTGISTSYISMREAARALNILQSSIIRYFKNNQKKPVKGRYIFVKR